MLIRFKSNVRSIKNRTRNGEIYNFGKSNNKMNLMLGINKFISWILQPGRDLSGAAIALFSANLHSPMTVTHKTTLQGVVYQLDIALQNVQTQSKGLIFIYDMSSSKYSNFDYDLSQKILTLLKVSTYCITDFVLETHKITFFFFLKMILIFEKKVSVW